MQYSSKKMDLASAQIISAWHYKHPYEIYSMTENDETIDKLMNCNYFSVHLNNTLFGYYCVGKAAQVPTEISKSIYENVDYIDIGLGMQPTLTGNGRGNKFLAYIIDCIKNDYPDRMLRLTVAKFNERAIHLYESFGFKKHFDFIKASTNTKFLIMLQK